MFEKISAGWNLLRKGEEVSNVEAWKTGHVTANAVAGVLVAAVALLKAFGYSLPIDDDTALTIGGGIVAVVNVVLTCITSKRAGILPARQSPVQDVQSGDQPQTPPVQPVDASAGSPNPNIDDATRQRAEEYVKSR